jgi:cytochrome c556
MSATPESSPAGTPSPAKKSSAAMRYLFLFLLGLVIGAIGVVMLMRTWDARKTPQDRLPEALMDLQAWHAGKLDEAIKQNRCDATNTIPHFRAMRSTGEDLEAAFPDLADDQRFKDHAAKYRGTLDAALASPPLDCAGVGATLKQVGEACKGCHQDFRN